MCLFGAPEMQTFPLTKYVLESLHINSPIIVENRRKAIAILIRLSHKILWTNSTTYTLQSTCQNINCNRFYYLYTQWPETNRFRVTAGSDFCTKLAGRFHESRNCLCIMRPHTLIRHSLYFRPPIQHFSLIY